MQCMSAAVQHTIHSDAEQSGRHAFRQLCQPVVANATIACRTDVNRGTGIQGHSEAYAQDVKYLVFMPQYIDTICLLPESQRVFKGGLSRSHDATSLAPTAVMAQSANFRHKHTHTAHDTVRCCGCQENYRHPT